MEEIFSRNFIEEEKKNDTITILTSHNKEDNLTVIFISDTQRL